MAVERLRERVDTLAFTLVPSPFSLREARPAFEAILGAPLDAQAFARLVVEQGWVGEVAGTGGAEPRFTLEAHARSWPWAAAAKG